MAAPAHYTPAMRITSAGRFVFVAQWFFAPLLPYFIVSGRVMVGSVPGWLTIVGWIYAIPVVALLLIPPIVTLFDRQAERERSTRLAYVVSSWILWSALSVMGLAVPDADDTGAGYSALSAWSGISLDVSVSLFSGASFVAIGAFLAQLVTASLSVAQSRKHASVPTSAPDTLPHPPPEVALQPAISDPRPGDDAGTKYARLAWSVGGVLLIGAALCGALTWLLNIPSAGFVSGGFVSAVLYAIAALVFAFGIRGAGSVTGRRPLGTAALALLAVWCVAHWIVWNLLPLDATPPEGQGRLPVIADAFLGATLAVTACVAIARAKVVPAPWNWAPCWVLLAVLILPSLLQPLEMVAILSPVELPLLGALSESEGLVQWAAAVFLGITAILLATRRTQRAPAPMTAAGT
jgi:hypothetical protein